MHGLQHTSASFSSDTTSTGNSRGDTRNLMIGASSGGIRKVPEYGSTVHICALAQGWRTSLIVNLISNVEKDHIPAMLINCLLKKPPLDHFPSVDVKNDPPRASDFNPYRFYTIIEHKVGVSPIQVALVSLADPPSTDLSTRAVPSRTAVTMCNTVLPMAPIQWESIFTNPWVTPPFQYHAPYPPNYQSTTDVAATTQHPTWQVPSVALLKTPETHPPSTLPQYTFCDDPDQRQVQRCLYFLT